MAFDTKYIGKSKLYKNVTLYRIGGKQIYYRGAVLKYSKRGFETEKEAAIWVDMRLIEAGKEPVNVLKRKKIEL
jgi:hypothetical protein